MTHAEQSPCRCGHARAAHEHLRRGTDCASCGRGDCTAFHAATSWWARMTTRRDHAEQPVPEFALATVIPFPQRDEPVRRTA